MSVSAETEGFGDESPVVVCGNRVCDPGRVCVGVNNTNGGDVVQATFVQQDVVLQRVQADNQIRSQGTLGLELLLKTLDLLVVVIDDLCATSAEDLRTVGDATRNPAVEQVTATTQFSSLDDNSVLTLASTNKEDETTTLSDTTNNSAGSAQV